MKKTNFASRSLVLLLTVLLALSLTACNAKGGEKMDNMGGGMSAMMDEPKNAEEATAMLKELTAEVKELLSKNPGAGCAAPGAGGHGRPAHRYQRLHAGRRRDRDL